MTSDTATFDLHRILPLTPEKLWHVMTDAKQREKWGAPDDATVLVVDSSDLREGGQDRHRCGPTDAPDFLVDTRWYHLSAPTRAVFTETLILGGDPAFTSLVTYALTPTEDGTALDISVATSSFSGPDALREVEGGWTGALNKLKAYAEQLLVRH
ncbi:SRPBCC domain-containing protein [Loktanella agnita]|uniref:SRPBCC domain-containing protein n=1 Tax=Loktanella agnita TaxID=287097 RepID=UPI003988E1CF